MRRILSIITALLLFASISQAQILERYVKATETVETGISFVYRGENIPVLDISYHEWSADSITWRKNYVSGDCYIRFSNDVKTTWAAYNICTGGGSGTSQIDTIFIVTEGVRDTIVSGSASIYITAPDTISGSSVNFQDSLTHTHELYIVLDDNEDVETSGVTNGQVIKWNSVTENWEASDDLIGGGAAGYLTVGEQGGGVSVTNVREILVENGRLTDNGVGSVSIDFLLEPVNGAQDFFRTDTLTIYEAVTDTFIEFSTAFPANDYILSNVYAIYNDSSRQNLVYDSTAADGFRVLSILDTAVVHYLAMRNLDTLGLAAANQGRVLADGGDVVMGYLNAKTDDSTITVTDSKLTVLSTPVESTSDSYYNIQHFINLSQSSGRIVGGGITDSGSQEVDVASGEGWIRVADDDMDTLMFFSWDAVVDSSISVGTTYIGVDYNSGSPKIVFSGTDNWNLDTNFPLGVIVRDNGTLHIMNNPYWVGDAITNITQRFQSDGIIKRDQFNGGLILGEVSGRKITVTSGKLWSRLNDYDISAFSTAATDSIDYYYRDGAGGFTAIYKETQWDSVRYDDGSGTLATMSNNYYAVNWFYIDTDGHVSVIYGRGQYPNSAAAENENPPSTTPDRINKLSILIGKLIFQEGSGTATSIETAFETSFTGTQASNHANLSNLDYNNSGHTGFVSTSESIDTTVSFAYQSLYVKSFSVDSMITTGEVRVGYIHHAFGGFQDSSVTLTLTTQGTWYNITNATQNLWTGMEADGITISNDTLTIVEDGDYVGNLSITFSGVNGRDFQLRVYNITQAKEEGYHIGGTTTGTSNFANISLPLYFEGNGGDEYVLQMRCTSTSGATPLLKSSVFYIQYLHE